MNKSAHDTYLERHAEFMANLEKAKIMIEAHATREATNQFKWGFAGDLKHFNNLLGQILGDLSLRRSTALETLCGA